MLPTRRLLPSSADCETATSGGGEQGLGESNCKRARQQVSQSVSEAAIEKLTQLASRNHERNFDGEFADILWCTVKSAPLAVVFLLSQGIEACTDVCSLWLSLDDFLQAVQKNCPKEAKDLEILSLAKKIHHV